MSLNDEYKGKLIAAYRRSLFEKENIAISKIDDLISDENLKAIISLNNREMCDLINKDNYDVDYVRRLLVANINFYRLAKHRSISIPGSSFLMTIASAIDYNMDKLYSELSVGAYYRPHRPR